MSKEDLNNNVDKTLHTAQGTFRKSRSIFSYENLFLDNLSEKTFGGSLYHSLLNGFSSVFKWEGLPEEIKGADIERFLNSSGRIKWIKVGRKHYTVHISPSDWTYTGDIKKSWIVEPYLGKLNGKKAENFPNVEIKNNSLGVSLIRMIYPFLNEIDETFFSLSVHSKVNGANFTYIVDETSSEDENDVLEDALNQWIINGKPIKVIKKTMLEDGKVPIAPLEIADKTDSFIKTILFNINQILNIVGIPNNNVEGKKERMITDEINIQNILQSSILDDMLYFRKEAVDKINKEFGLQVSVSLRDDINFEKEVEDDNKDKQEMSE